MPQSTAIVPPRQVFLSPDTLETMADVERYGLTTTMPLTHAGRPFEPIGRTIQRAIDKEPDPFSKGFRDRFAVSVAEDPAFYGRLLLHALRSIREGSRRG